MKYTFRFLILVVIGFHGFTTYSQKKPVDYVNVFTGTSNSRWMLGPYAGVPYGMVQLGPDNQESGWMAGYDYSIMNVTGFSHLHAWTMAGLMVMPATQDFTKDNGASSKAYRGAGAGFHSRILKETEKASPGYYSCELYDADCKAELTASTHCGFHKYTFKAKDNVRILLALNFPTEYKIDIRSAVLNRIGNNVVEGFARTGAGYGEYTLYFTIQFNKPFKAFNGWHNDSIQTNIDQIKGIKDVGAFVTYSTTEDEAIMMKVGLSLVDMDGARNNLKSELDPFGWNFEAAKESASEKWNTLLSRIEVKGSEQNMEKFYTNLYRSFAKQTWSDADGRYADPFNKIQQLPKGGVMYGGDAFWNTFWNYNTILSLIAPDIMNNWVQTELELFDKTGWTNDGPTGLKLTGIMEVTHEIALMVSAYQKGIRNYDVNKLYKAVRHNGMEQGVKLPGQGLSGMERLNIYNRLGYVPFEIDAASRTLDYAYTDFCSAQLAKAMKQDGDYSFFLHRSNNWKNQFHPELKMQVPKDSTGHWMKDFDQFSGKHWIEGNAWQYMWYVPHDIQGLVSMMGKDLFTSRLEEGFQKSEKHNFTAHAFDRHQDIAFEYYVNHGNEGNMQASFLFNYSGKPWLTQKYSRAILDKYYGNTPYHGWEGDEDEGQMGGWFVIASMGLFEMNGGVTDDPTFDLTSPLFDEITIHLDKMYNGGKPFVIKTINNSDENIYIQSATLNGKPFSNPKLRFNELVKGGELVFKMGANPNKGWGQNEKEGKNMFKVRLDVNDADGVIYDTRSVQSFIELENQTDVQEQVKIEWSISTDNYIPLFKTPIQTITIGQGLVKSYCPHFQFPGPGFYRIEARVSKTDGEVFERIFTVGINPEKISTPVDAQPDFEEFWKNSLSELKKINPAYRVTPVERNANSKTNLFRVEIKSVGDITVRGWLELPKKTGKYPALLRVPGYGENLKPLDKFDDLVVFSFSPRNHGESDDIGGRVDDMWVRGLEKPEGFFYHELTLDCLQALEYLCSRDDVDTSRIAVWGGSQGGGLSFALAALDDRVDMCIADIPFLCEFPRLFETRHKDKDMWFGKNPSHTWQSMLKTLSYFDVKNMAYKISCPVYMGIGLQDYTCPPATSFAAYNHIVAKKEYSVYKYVKHEQPASHYEKRFMQLREYFGMDKK